MDRDVRKQFASSFATKLQKLAEIPEDIEMKWSLFQTAKISSAFESYEQKWLRMVAGCKKTTSWWNQDVREAI